MSKYRSSRLWTSQSRSLAGIAVLALVVSLLSGALLTPAAAASTYDGLSFRLQGCDLPVSTTLPNGSGDFICPDAAYTDGNLGKNWSELDLVPHRILIDAGNSAPAQQTYTFRISADYSNTNNQNVTRLGWDFIENGFEATSSGCLNPTISDPQTVVGVVPAAQTVYREITVTQSKNTTCQIDLYIRLAVGAHLYPGSSLHTNLLNDQGTTQGIGNKENSIPVNEIEPQTISKTMSATQDTDFTWNVVKSPSPANLDFGDVCGTSFTQTKNVDITVTWTKIQTAPGPITIITNVYANNPSHRVITVSVSDEILTGTTPVVALTGANPATLGPVDVPANTANFLVGTHTITVASGTTGLNDVATATYTDKVTGIPVPGTTTAIASATVQPGVTTNTNAVITDVENITGGGLTFAVNSATGASGTFQNGYATGTFTTGPVTWVSGTQAGDGSVTFHKTVKLDPKQVTSGTLTDTATLLASPGGFTTSSGPLNVGIASSASVSLSINKSIDVLLDEQVSFGFNYSGPVNGSATVNIAAGQLSGSATVLNLPPGTYTVSEQNPGSAWTPGPNQQVTIGVPACSGSVSFSNQFNPPSAKAIKITQPPGGQANWSMLLSGSDGSSETVSTGANGEALFTTTLKDGVTYTITETLKPGYEQVSSSGDCQFKVDLPKDAGKTFACTFTNRFNPTVTLEKTGEGLSKPGDKVDYSFKVTNTSPPGPDLVCTVSDTDTGFTSNPITLASGASQTVTQTDFVIPIGANDPFVNHARVDCTFVGSAATVASAIDDWSTNLFQPSIKVTKTADVKYSKAGDKVTYTVTIENTSSTDSPALKLASFTDSRVSGVTPPASCGTLAAKGDSCTFSYSYTVQAGDPDPLVNTATALYHPEGFPNDVSNSATASVDLLHPSFTVTKVCKAEPVSQAGPAVFTITFTNTGDANLHVVPSEGTPFDVVAGGSHSYNVSVPGPFSASVVNTVTGTVTLDGTYGLGNSYTFSATDTCDVFGKAKVVKTVSGSPPASGQSFTFELRQGASTASDGTTLETKNTDATGNISFTTDLVPGQTYQMCEWVFPGWNTTLSGDGPLFVPNSIIPPSLPNPNVNNLTVCVNFTVSSGQTRVFTVDNTPPPGGRALTIGFWKNWTSCANSNGKGQKPVLDQTLAAANVIPDGSGKPGIVISATSGSYDLFGPLYYLVIHGSNAAPNAAPDCLQAVRLLSKSTIDAGKKMASDPAFNLAAQLLAAELNFTAGAAKNGTVVNAVNQAVLLLGKYQFNGISHTNISKADATTMNSLAVILDNYNNNI